MTERQSQNDETIVKPTFTIEPGVGALPLKLGMTVEEVYDVLNNQSGLGIEEREPVMFSRRYGGQMKEGKAVWRGLHSTSMVPEKTRNGIGDLYYFKEGERFTLACIELSGVMQSFDINKPFTYYKLDQIPSKAIFWGRDIFRTSFEELENVIRDLGLEISVYQYLDRIDCSIGLTFFYEGLQIMFPRRVFIYDPKVIIG